MRKVAHPNGKFFHFACNGPDCPYESEEISYTTENYHAAPPRTCPRCGRSGTFNNDLTNNTLVSNFFGKKDS
jgi:hypothetical protein